MLAMIAWNSSPQELNFDDRNNQQTSWTFRLGSPRRAAGDGVPYNRRA
jgi:hypothetical protein